MKDEFYPMPPPGSLLFWALLETKIAEFHIEQLKNDLFVKYTKDEGDVPRILKSKEMASDYKPNIKSALENVVRDIKLDYIDSREKEISDEFLDKLAGLIAKTLSEQLVP